jgi:hypothetical protein
MTMHEIDRPPVEEPLASLERLLISEYVTAAGLDLASLLLRHDEQATRILTEAARHAGEKLAEVEARSHYLKKLHGEE